MKKVKKQVDGKDIEAEEPETLEEYQAALAAIADKHDTLTPEEFQRF